MVEKFKVFKIKNTSSKGYMYCKPIKYHKEKIKIQNI